MTAVRICFHDHCGCQVCYPCLPAAWTSSMVDGSLLFNYLLMVCKLKWFGSPYSEQDCVTCRGWVWQRGSWCYRGCQEPWTPHCVSCCICPASHLPQRCQPAKQQLSSSLPRTLVRCGVHACCACLMLEPVSLWLLSTTVAFAIPLSLRSSVSCCVARQHDHSE